MKIYRFDYLREWVDKFSDKSHVTLSQLLFLPWDISLPWIMPDKIIPSTDHYGDVIEDINEWNAQREAYLEDLWMELGGYVDPILPGYVEEAKENWRKRQIKKLMKNELHRKTN